MDAAVNASHRPAEKDVFRDAGSENPNREIDCLLDLDPLCHMFAQVVLSQMSTKLDYVAAL